MLITMLKSKLHHARITRTELEYEGSCAIDGHLLQAAGIFMNEQIHIYNMANGERLVTYAIFAEPGSGIISLNGAAAHKASAGDRVIICAYASIDIDTMQDFQPRVICVDEGNKIKSTSIQTEAVAEPA